MISSMKRECKVLCVWSHRGNFEVFFDCADVKPMKLFRRPGNFSLLNLAGRWVHVDDDGLYVRGVRVIVRIDDEMCLARPLALRLALGLEVE